METKSELEIFESQIAKENQIDDIMDKAGTMSKGEELGFKPINTSQIKKIMKQLSYEELRDKGRSEFVEKEGENKFYIGTKDKLKGRISFVETEHKQKIILGRITKKPNNETGDFKYRTYYLAETIPPKDKIFIWDEIIGEFYLYKLITENQTYQIFSTEKLEMGEYNIWGTIIEVMDHIDMGNKATITKKLPILFIHSAFKKESQIQSHKEFKERFRKYDLTEEKFMSWFHTSPNGWVYEFPKSFTYIQIANTLACKDEVSNYRLPALMISESGPGKTTSEDCIYPKYNEILRRPNLNLGTMKGLLPSFAKAYLPEAGNMINSLRRMVLDELFKGIKTIRSELRNDFMEDLRSVLDYHPAGFNSGQGRFNAVMEADCIAYANPKGYGDNIMQLSNHFFPEALCCWFIWFIPSSQKKFIDMKKGTQIKGEYSFIAKSDFLEGIDYLKTFNCDYDIDKIREIYKIGENFLKSRDELNNVFKFYTSRYFEHCCRLLDALTKFRCWTSGDIKFKATPQDYELVKKLWLEMLENWNIGFLQVEYEKLK